MHSVGADLSLSVPNFLCGSQTIAIKLKANCIIQHTVNR